MNRLKAIAIQLFGEDLWREWCEVCLVVALGYCFGWSERTIILIAVYIFGRGAFKRLRTLNLNVSAIAARPPQVVERPALTPAQAAATRAARGLRP